MVGIYAPLWNINNDYKSLTISGSISPTFLPAFRSYVSSKATSSY